MNYTKSSLPYLCLLLCFVFGIPFLNQKIKRTQSIDIEIKPKIVMPQEKVFAQQKDYRAIRNQQLPSSFLMISK